MDRNNVIVTIGRQTGSNGREIGQLLAKTLGVKCYDRELLALAAKEGGFDEKVVEHHDEKPTSSFLYSLYMSSVPFSYSGSSPLADLPLDHKIFLAQFDAIHRIADSENCVIVGRCADYALEKRDNVLSVFILADEEDKVKRIAEREQCSADKAREMMLKGDRKRSSYYNYYTNRRWGTADNYDLCINSSRFTTEGCVNMILTAIDAGK